jgi:hypothetical protein
MSSSLLWMPFNRNWIGPDEHGVFKPKQEIPKNSTLVDESDEWHVKQWDTTISTTLSLLPQTTSHWSTLVLPWLMAVVYLQGTVPRWSMQTDPSAPDQSQRLWNLATKVTLESFNPNHHVIMSSCHHVPWIRHWAPLDTTVEHSLGPQPQAAWVVWFPKGQGLPQILGLMGAPPCQGLRGNWKRTPTIGYGHCLVMVGNNI